VKTYRLAVLNSHPIQYFGPMYRRLAQEPEIDLTVFYCSRQGVDDYVDAGFEKSIRWDVPILDGYRYKFLSNVRGRAAMDGPLSLINPAIVGELFSRRYDALWLHGYIYASDWLGLVAANLSKTPVFYRSESSLTYDARVKRPLHIRLIKPRLLKWLFGRMDRFLAIGSLNREFYLSHGVERERIHHVPYTVDNAYFQSRSSEFRARRDEIRSAMGIAPNDVVFLFAAKMNSKKVPLQMLEAYGRLGSMPGKALIMAGDGQLRPTAEEYVAAHGIGGVHFTGFVNQSELPKYYAISDVFVRPDGLYIGDWGLTINEAMAAGLAVITTDCLGAAADLVKHGDNGLLVGFGKIEELASAMRVFIENPHLCAGMGAKSSEIILGWSYEECVHGVLQALRSEAQSW
jgi:glycosyltransferase involved in cell wall biosynthesis